MNGRHDTPAKEDSTKYVYFEYSMTIFPQTLGHMCDRFTILGFVAVGQLYNGVLPRGGGMIFTKKMPKNG